MQNSMNQDLSLIYYLIVENLLPAQDEIANADTGDALFSHRPLIVDNLGIMSSALPLQENIFLGLFGAVTLNNSFPDLTLPENQADTARRDDETQRYPLDPRLFQCPVCEYTSDKRFNVKEHLKKHDPNRKREFHCSECPQQFFRRHDRNRHFSSVHENERYICPHCANHYSRVHNLMSHINRAHYRM